MSDALYVYILTNKRNGTLYIGVTNDLVRRVFEHRQGAMSGFSSRYGLKNLVYFEQFDDPINAIQREKTLKHWPRQKKIQLIEGVNLLWRDLYDDIGAP